MPTTFDPSSRWSIQFKAAGGVWRTLGTAGSESQAIRWLARLCVSTGDYRIQRPRGTP